MEKKKHVAQYALKKNAKPAHYLFSYIIINYSPLIFIFQFFFYGKIDKVFRCMSGVGIRVRYLFGRNCCIFRQ